MDPSLTVASVDDVPATCTLLAAQFAEHDIALSGDALRAAVEGLVAVPSRGVVLLAHEGDVLAGVAVLATTWTLEHGGLVAWLDELYVVPDRRGRGIGGALLAHALEVARERRWLALELEIDEQHARAAHLYERAGFRRLSRTRWSHAQRPNPI